MKKRYLLVDAYNMIGHWPELEKLKKADELGNARDLLLEILANYQKHSGFEIIVVFDAMFVPGLTQSYEQYDLKVVWTAENETADHYIEKLAKTLQTSLTYVVVATNDQAEQWAIFTQGATRLPAWELYQNIKRMNKEISQQAQTYQDQASVRRSPWNSDQLDKLASLRDYLSD